MLRNIFYHTYPVSVVNGAAVIPEGEKKIFPRAFSGREDLVTAVIPEGITEINESAFSGCTNLTEVVLPSTLREIDSGAFRNCVNLRSISIPDGVRVIASETFYDCNELTEVEIASSVKRIEMRAFYNCVKLRPPVFPDKIEIECDAFGGCEGMADEDGFMIIKGVLCGYFGSSTDVIIPENVREISVTAFWHRKDLTSVIIPEQVKTVRWSTFSECSKLADENGFIVLNGVLCGYVGNDREITVPKGVRYLSDFVFLECKDITSVTLPEGVLSIGALCFSFCTSLVSVSLPDTLTEIGMEAFDGCSCLKSLTIPASVSRFGDWADGRWEIEADNDKPYRFASRDTVFLEMPDLVLHVFRGSYAEKYAEENGVPFEYAD